MIKLGKPLNLNPSKHRYNYLSQHFIPSIGNGILILKGMQHVFSEEHLINDYLLIKPERAMKKYEA